MVMEKKLEQEIDRISSLPYSIHSLIVSFLPIKDGIKTKILSKNWRHVCASFTNFSFSQYEYQSNTHTTKQFKDVVNHTLGFHDGSPIHNFALRIHNADELSTPLILEWVSFALSHNVQQLVIDMPREFKKLPPNLFTCGTLTILELFEVDLTLPTSFKFPVLKDLSLCCVSFYGEKLLDQLIPSCPVLEKLCITSCFWENQVVINLITSTLKVLMLRVPNPDLGDIKISAPNLCQIFYMGIPPDISRESFTSTANAIFTFSFPSSSNNCVLNTLCHRANIIFRGQHNFEDLTLRGLVFEYLSRIQDLFSRPLTSCLSLKALTLWIRCSEDYVYATLFLLKNCPNLQDLTICIQEKSTSLDVFNMERYSESQKLVAGSSLKHLKAVRLYHFTGSQDELILAKYLLENAVVMNEMKIRFSHGVKEDERENNISQNILALTKASPHAIFHSPEDCF